MLSLKTLIVALALYLSIVAAHPVVHTHHRRGACKPAPSDSGVQSSLLTVETSTVVSPGHSSSTPKPESTGKPEPSSSAVPHSSSSVPHSGGTGSSSSGAPNPSSSGIIGGIVGSLKALFPVSQSTAWTTSKKANDPLPLSDSTFRPTKLMKELSHKYVNAPDGKPAMQAHYPKGSYNFQHEPLGGFSFYAPGPSSLDLTTAKEATFGYSVYFEKDFDWVKGGKLPGLYGGDDDEVSVSCSGGRRSDACFSARLMWRADAMGEFYTYLPPYTESKFSANKKQCTVKPESDCNPTYGASVGRGAFHFAPGAWTTISERVRLNDVGKANGELELFVNGKSVINVSGLIIRARDAGRIRGIQAQTFFGGSSTDFATPKDQNVWFSDFSVAITEKL